MPKLLVAHNSPSCSRSSSQPLDHQSIVVNMEEEDDADMVARARPSTAELKCSICGGTADGQHFGADACRACAAFFRRTIARRLKYVCRFDDDCEIGNACRSVCRSCRLAKCYRVGMNSRAVRSHQHDASTIARPVPRRFTSSITAAEQLPNIDATASSSSSVKQQQRLGSGYRPQADFVGVPTTSDHNTLLDAANGNSLPFICLSRNTDSVVTTPATAVWLPVGSTTQLQQSLLESRGGVETTTVLLSPTFPSTIPLSQERLISRQQSTITTTNGTVVLDSPPLSSLSSTSSASFSSDIGVTMMTTVPPRLVAPKVQWHISSSSPLHGATTLTTKKSNMGSGAVSGDESAMNLSTNGPSINNNNDYENKAGGKRNDVVIVVDDKCDVASVAVAERHAASSTDEKADTTTPTSSASSACSTFQRKLLYDIVELSAIDYFVDERQLPVTHPTLTRMLVGYELLQRRRDVSFSRSREFNGATTRIFIERQTFDVYQYWKNIRMELEWVAEMLSTFDGYRHIPSSDKVHIYKNYWIHFIILERNFDTYRVLGSTNTDLRMVFANGDIIDVINGVYDVEKVVDEHCKTVLSKPWFRTAALEVLSPLNKIQPTEVEMIFCLGIMLWTLNYDTLLKVSPETGRLAEHMTDVLYTEIFAYYTTHFPHQNFARRIAELTRLIGITQKLVIERREDMILQRTFRTFKIDLYMDEIFEID